MILYYPPLKNAVCVLSARVFSAVVVFKVGGLPVLGALKSEPVKKKKPAGSVCGVSDSPHRSRCALARVVV